MKSMNETFEDEVFEKMKNFKGKLSWHDFIILMFTHCKEAEKKGDFGIRR